MTRAARASAASVDAQGPEGREPRLLCLRPAHRPRRGHPQAAQYPAQGAARGTAQARAGADPLWRPRDRSRRGAVREICRMGGEGIISKKAEAPYRGTRTRDWLKIKCIQRQEFVIVGWSESDKRRGFRSLLLAVRDRGKLTYAGKVGTGFNAKLIEDLMERMEPLETGKAAGRGPARRPQGRALDRAEARRRNRLQRVYRRRGAAPPKLHCAARGQAGEGGRAGSAEAYGECHETVETEAGLKGEEGPRDRGGLRHRNQQSGTRHLPRARADQEGSRRLLCDRRAADHGGCGKAADRP